MLRSLVASGRYQEVANVAETAIESSGTDYNVYVPIVNAMAALGKTEALDNMRQREILAFEKHLKEVLGFSPKGDVFKPGTLPRQEGKAQRVFFQEKKKDG